MVPAGRVHGARPERAAPAAGHRRHAAVAAYALAHGSIAAWWGAGDGGPGRRFLAGQVSNAFALVGGTLALRALSTRASRLWLMAVCELGLVRGLTQLLRGALCASHSLWTAWICWTLSALLWHSAAAMPQRFNRLRELKPKAQALCIGRSETATLKTE